MGVTLETPTTNKANSYIGKFKGLRKIYDSYVFNGFQVLNGLVPGESEFIIDLFNDIAFRQCHG